MKVRQVPVSELQTDENNARLHNQRNLEVIANSLEKFGQRKPIVVHNNIVIAGNGTLEAAKLLGWKEITITEVPENWDLDTAKAYALADNRTAELAEWNEDVLISQLMELENEGWDIKEFGFDEMLAEIAEESQKQENVYSNKVTIPQYNIVGEEPSLSDLFDTTKTDELKERINASDLPSEIKKFLTLAANRHTVFNYKKIAEFYPHQSELVQELMEQSALVIIDIDDAIANGYANFLTTITEYDKQDTDD